MSIWKRVSMFQAVHKDFIEGILVFLVGGRYQYPEFLNLRAIIIYTYIFKKYIYIFCRKNKSVIFCL